MGLVWKLGKGKENPCHAAVIAEITESIGFVVVKDAFES